MVLDTTSYRLYTNGRFSYGSRVTYFQSWAVGFRNVVGLRVAKTIEAARVFLWGGERLTLRLYKIYV